MNDFLIYLLQSAFCLAALYLIYWLFLRRDTFFRANRFYLISSLFLSFILPLFKVPVFYNDPQVTYVVVLETVTVTAEKIASGIIENWTIYQTLMVVYLAGVAIFLIRFVFQLAQLFWLIRKYEVIKKDGLNIVKLDKKYSPFSYFNYVFLTEEILNDQNLQEIIRHEKIHINQRHSVDLIIMEMFIILQWFNPFVWLYKFSLKGIHEFLADEGLLSNGTNKLFYQNLLLNQTVGIQINDLTNNFNQSLIKKRFIMMTKMKSKGKAKLKYLLTIPITALLIAFFAVSLNQNVFAAADNEEAKAAPINPEKDPANQEKETKEQIFMVVEEMPEFIEGSKKVQDFIQKNIKYPSEARKKGIQGRVYISFVIETDGSITDPRIVRGIGFGCDEEALRVVKMMKFKPGKQRGEKVRVQFNIPIAFVLDNNAAISSGPTIVKYVKVDVQPEFPGGKEAMHKFIAENIKYPEEARKNKLEGKVYIAFTVLKDGTVGNMKITKGLGYGLDAEAMRVINQLKFKPGMKDGEPVNVVMSLPIEFKLN